MAFVSLGFSVQAQKTNGFKAGTHIGVPLGNASKETSFNFGIDASYTWKVAKDFDLGLATGYTYYTEKNKTQGRDYGFLPIALAAQYYFNQNIYLGADLGYAIGAIEGGFYYQPKLGYDLGHSSLFLSFKGISGSSGLNSLFSDDERISLSSINLGYTYRFGK